MNRLRERKVKAPGSRLFALGVFPQRDARLPVGPSDEDRLWAAEHLNAATHCYEVVGDDDGREEAEDAAIREAWAEELAARAEERRWQDAYEAGHYPG